MRVELKHPWSALLSPRQLGFGARYHFYDPCFWRRGLWLHLQGGHAVFLGNRKPHDALADLLYLIDQSEGERPVLNGFVIAPISPPSRRAA